MTTLLVLTLLPAIGLGQKEKPEAPAYPVPFISELSPVSTTPGGDDFTLTVRGTGLLTGQSVIYWNGVALPDPTTCTAAQPPQLASCTATVRAEEIATAGTAEITVVNPDAEPLEGISNVVFFPITLATSSVNTSRTDYAAGKESYSVAVGDFNGDGKLDLAVANARSDNVTILLGNGDGTFTATASSPVTGSGSWYVVVGDFNGDGKLDLATEGAVLLGNGDGTFTAAPSSSGLGGVAAAVGDFNGDGKLDLAVANQGSNNVTILLGNGDGTFTAAASSPATGALPTSVAVGDFNGDGKPDLAVANEGSNNVTILLGNGDGTFTASASSPATGIRPGSVAVGDFNGDGKLDLAVANECGTDPHCSSAGTVTILLGNGDGTFTATASSPGTGYSPSSVAVGDFNGDGKLDLVVSGCLDNSNCWPPDGTLTLLLGNGDGTFTATASSLATGSVPASVAVGDFNGDGRLDFVTADQGSGPFPSAISILLQAPDLTITKSHSENFTQGQIGATYTITASNGGSAATSATVTMTDTLPLPGGLNATAMSGSGWTCTVGTLTCARSDVLAAGSSYPPITLTVNVAGNAPSLVTNTATVSGGGETNTANDTAQDQTVVLQAHVTDLTVSKAHAGDFWRGETGAAYTITVTDVGSAPTSATVAVSDTLPGGLTATAMSGSGWTCTVGTLTCSRSDVLGGNSSYPPVTLTVNVASNAPSSVTNTARVSGGGESNTANDTANDPTTIFQAPTYPVPFISEVSPLSTAPGRGDFTLTVRGTGFLNGQSVIYWNGVALPDSTTCTAARPPQLASCTATVRAEEIATPRTAEITVVNPDAFEGTSNVVFFPITIATSTVITRGTNYRGGYSWTSVAVGDFNGDGKLDLAVGDEVLNNVTILLGNGDGTFTATASSPRTGSYPTSVAVGDFNGDGKLDLAVADAGSNYVTILLGNGDGTFTSTASSPGTGTWPTSLAVGDFNGDGKLDLAVMNVCGNDPNCLSAGSVTILLGNGDGTFTPTASSPATGIQPYSVAVGDFNGDGKLDLAVANWSSDNVTILLGNGDGSFRPTALSPATGVGPLSVAVGDFNGDGKLDLAVTNENCLWPNYCAGSVTILLGNGDGTFTATASSPATGQYPNSVAVGDFNGDGKLDLVTANFYSGDVTILLGNGDGTFTANASSPATGINSYAVAVGDFNGGGRLDFVTANPDDRPFSNDVTVLLQLLPPTADSVTPNAASGPDQTFTLEYSVHDRGKDYTDLSWVFVRGNLEAYGCMVGYTPGYRDRLAGLYLMNDAGTAWQGPLAPGSAGTLSNSQCTVNGTGSSASGSGQTLTLTLSLSATPIFVGTQDLYMQAGDTEGVWSGWQNRGTWTPAADTAPSADSVTPNPASGVNQTFALNYSVHNGRGYSDLMWLYVRGNLEAHGCMVGYTPGYGGRLAGLYLLNDAGTAWLGPLAPGATGTLGNSQCTVNGAGSSVSGSGQTLTLNLSLSATAIFVGTQQLYMQAEDREGTWSAWQQRGTWTPAADAAPTADSVSPNAATGANQTFTLKYSAQNNRGYGDLTWVYVRGNLEAHGCMVGYTPGYGGRLAGLYLLNDAGTAWLGPLTPGTGGTLSNPQCTVNGAGSSVSGSGQTLTLNLSLSATAIFVGTQGLYMQAEDREGTWSAWQQRGTWTPAADTPPTADSVTPSAATGPNQTFTLKYSTQNGRGYTDLALVYFRGNLEAHGCLVGYYQPANSLYLLNDAGTAWQGPLAPGTAGSLSNSQCTVNGAGSASSGSGQTLTLNLSLSATALFVGTQRLNMQAEDREGTWSAWQQRGTWTPND